MSEAKDQGSEDKAWRLLTAAGWMVAGLFAARTLLANAPEPLLHIVLLLPLFGAALLLHEAGHALGALVVGWRILAVAAGPLGYHLANRQLVYVPPRRRADIGGFVIAFPARPTVWTRESEVIFTAGGPTASLFGALPLLVSADNMAGAFAILSLATALLSLLPYRSEFAESDGTHLWHLATGRGRASPEWRASQMLHELVRHQLRLRELPAWMLDEALASTDSDARRSAEALRVSIALDRGGDPAPARRILDDFRAAHGGSLWLDLCDAYLAAAREARPEHARALLADLVVEQEDMRPLHLAASAASAAADGNRPRALDELETLDALLGARDLFEDPTFRDLRAEIRALAELQSGIGTAPTLTSASASVSGGNSARTLSTSAAVGTVTSKHSVLGL
ncbi:hypothetical protein [Sphingomonas swuensis]